jgi:hypothetical protein
MPPFTSPHPHGRYSMKFRGEFDGLASFLHLTTKGVEPDMVVLAKAQSHSLLHCANW